MIEKYTDTDLYSQEWRPSDDQILAAARVIDSDLRFYGLLREYPTYEEMLISDPIGASEWGGTIERMLLAAHKAQNDD
ncbi:MAG: hypothetical protein M0R77_18445 [Gammaproteobacteria bacterium]|nr:hypothetical protein [Gammaproteobacteria bacterium]